MTIFLRGSVTIPLAAAVVNVEGEESAAAAQIHKNRPHKEAAEYSIENEEHLEDHIPGIVGLTVDTFGTVSKGIFFM
jgi:hypothetical protein